MVGCLAISKAGHDKGAVYMILKEEERSVCLADGTGKTAACPKKKNKKHIQVIKNGMQGTPAEAVRRKLESGQKVTDEEIKYALKQYQKELRQFAE